jgi:hypothetical protein
MYAHTLMLVSRAVYNLSLIQLSVINNLLTLSKSISLLFIIYPRMYRAKIFHWKLIPV